MFDQSLTLNSYAIKPAAVAAWTVAFCALCRHMGKRAGSGLEGDFGR